MFPLHTRDLTPELLTRSLGERHPGVRVGDFDVVEEAHCHTGSASTAARAVLDLGYAPGAPGSDPWYAAQLLARGEAEEQTFALRVDGLVDTDEVPAVLRVDLWGVTDWPANDADHHVEVILNEVVVADEVFDGVVERVVSVPVEPGLIREGGNALTIGLPGDTGERYGSTGMWTSGS